QSSVGRLFTTKDGSLRGTATGLLQQSGTSFLGWRKQLDYCHEMSREPGAVHRAPRREGRFRRGRSAPARTPSLLGRNREPAGRGEGRGEALLGHRAPGAALPL